MTNIIATLPAESTFVLLTSGTGFAVGIIVALGYAFERPIKAFFSILF